MQALSGASLLNLWERGFGLHPLDRGLLALSAAVPEVPANFADWPLGRRNRALVDLHCCCFGSRLQAWTSCTRCGEKMEFELDGRALVKEGSNGDAGPNGMVRVKGHSFRLPTSRDLACAAESNDHQTAAIRLVERCRMGAGESPAWSVEDLEEIGEALSLADPSAEPQVALRCPACNDEWNVTLDLATFLWAEIEARAKRLLWEVHTLASVYGWTQREILSLGEVRRNLYLEMVRA